MNVIEIIGEKVQSLLESLFKIDPEVLHRIQITINTDKQKQEFGDLSSNAALILAKELGENPRAVAQKICGELTHPFIARIDIAGPGFINIVLSEEAFKKLAQELYEERTQFFTHTRTPKKSYCVEFVSANPTGPLHIGHGRGGIIGDVLARILSFLGHSVVKEFYINDAGSQIQKLGLSFKIRCIQIAGYDRELPEDGYHGDYLKILAQTCYTEYGDELLSKSDEFFSIYAQEHLLRKIQQTLQEYGITFDVWFSEKTLHDSGAISHVLEQVASLGYLYTEDSTTWLRTTAFHDDKDRVVRKKSGELTYIAADIAYVQNKIARDFDHLIYVLGQDHHSYVIRLKAVMAALGYDPTRLDVILYQLVTIKEGGQALRLSKRAGRIITLEDIIQTVGTDVARFFYLHKKADAHLDFDLDLALKHTDENPVYYIQYAYVRIKSIREKAYAYEEFHRLTSEDIQGLGAAEGLLLKKVASLKEHLESIQHSYQTHQLAYYTIELAQAFHTYYSHHKVIDTDHVAQSRARLVLLEIVESTLKTCFDLLGISAPEKM
jgi:arginyl-tRNA synthetase